MVQLVLPSQRRVINCLVSNLAKNDWELAENIMLLCSHKKKMKLIPLLCIVFIKASEGCNHQNDEKLSKFHTLIRGNEISIRSTGSSQERWHIIRDSICKAKLTCKNFYIPPSEDCLKSSLEVIDGDLIKLRFCGYSSILGEYFLFTKGEICRAYFPHWGLVQNN